MSDPAPSPKHVPYLASLASAVAGAVVMWWSLSDRMEKQITEKVNLVSRVAQLAERLEGQRTESERQHSEIQNLRAELNALRIQPKQPTP